MKVQSARRQSERCKVQGVKVRGASYDAGQGRVLRVACGIVLAKV
jgi:hypothetical protein